MSYDLLISAIWNISGFGALPPLYGPGSSVPAIRCDDDEDDVVASTAPTLPKKPRDPKDWLYKHQLVFCPKCKCIYSLTCTEHGVKWNDGD
jgi:hypothetical protein